MPVNNRRLAGLVLKADIEALSGIKDQAGNSARLANTEDRSRLSVDFDRSAPNHEMGGGTRTCGLRLGAARAELESAAEHSESGGRQKLTPGKIGIHLCTRDPSVVSQGADA